MTILIVDDEPLIRRSLQKVFEAKGHDVITAEDGISGLKLWKTHAPKVVMLDVLMPGLTGPQVVKEMGSEHGAKVVLMSAYSGESKQLSDLKMDLFLPKPFEDIFKVINCIEALGHEQ